MVIDTFNLFRVCVVPVYLTSLISFITHVVGYYMYLRAAGGDNGDWMRLVSPVIQTSRASCARFYYHANGDDIHVLDAYWANWQEAKLAFRIDGGSRPVGWHVAMISMPPGQNKLIFEGHLNGRDKGDLAIDDVTVWNHECEEFDESHENMNFPWNFRENLEHGELLLGMCLLCLKIQKCST